MATQASRKRAASPRRSPAADRRSPRGSNWKLRPAGALRILEAPPLGKLGWLVHGFSTRAGGVSQLERRSGGGKSDRVLNLGFTDWDSGQHVARNRSKFAEALGAGRMRMVSLRQAHSDVVCLVDGSSFTQDLEPPQGDALFTREPGVLLAVQIADCLPILLADTRTHTVAAIHSGWRGTLRRIAEKTLGRMRMEFGTQPEDVIAAIGPGIGGCCYEVGHEVAKEFAAQFPKARIWFDAPFAPVATGDNDPNWLPWLTMRPPGHSPDPPRVRLDLAAASRDILAAAGVRPRRIFASGFCTSCRTDLFFSYRRERTTGRLMAAIGIL